jgi:hypothetical protein
VLFCLGSHESIGGVRAVERARILAACGVLDDHDYTASGDERSRIVTPLGKEKKLKEPWWTQDGEHYELTEHGVALSDRFRELREVDSELLMKAEEAALAAAAAAEAAEAAESAAGTASELATEIEPQLGTDWKGWASTRGLLLRSSRIARSSCQIDGRTSSES